MNLIDRHNDVYAPVIGFDSDIEVVSADGTWVTDVNGKEYLDFACGISVTNVGHNHPLIVSAVQEQLGKVWHAGGVFRYESLIRAAEKIVAVTPEPIDKMFFMNSGAEAVEASVKLARKVSGRQGIVVFRGAFHGRTMGAVTYTTSKAKYRQGYHPLVPSVFVAPFPHPYRWSMTEDEATEHALMELELMLMHEVTPGEVAAFLVEPQQGEGGYYPAPMRFLDRLRDLADEHGIFLILDEVQTGFGRTERWFASDHYENVEPDIMILGKAIANGLPLSGVAARSDILDEWPPGSHGTTFGGNPVACAAAAATVDAVAEVLPSVPQIAKEARAGLEDLQERHPTIGDVRGLGMMLGVELVGEGNDPNPEAFSFLSDHAREAGLLILDCGPFSNVIRFIPPINISSEDLKTGLAIIDDALTAYESR